MGKSHAHRTHDHSLGLFGGWERLRIRFRGRPAKRELYTSRVGSWSLPLSLPNPSNHARCRNRNRYGHVPLPALEPVVRTSPTKYASRTTLHVSLRPCENPSPSCRLLDALTRTIHEYLLLRPIFSPGGAFLLRPPRRTASTPPSASLARNPGGLRSRTPRDGIHE
jgi:hypothetical protein